jgi:hypothetical protein
MWHKVLNLEKTLFPALQEELRLEELSSKEQKLINSTFAPKPQQQFRRISQ